MKQRGIAMIIVLFTMTLIMSAVALIARTRTTDHLTRSHAVRDAQLGDLLISSDGPIRVWLEQASQTIVLPPEAESSMIRVLENSFIHQGAEIGIRIYAWDQQGMFPKNSEELGFGSPIKTVAWKNSDLLGVDEGSAAAFPTPHNPAAIGGLIATHNPWPTRSGTTRARGGAQININTAPRALIESVHERFNLSDPSWIFEKRSASEFVVLTKQIEGADRTPMSFVSASSVWSFRIDARIGTISRSCWCVYASQGGSWRMVQRVAID